MNFGDRKSLRSGILIVLSLVATMATVAGFASAQEQESEIKLKAEDINSQKNKTPGDDVDDLITNNLLRAESGSKSRYSIASTLVYNGGSVQTPLAEDRPNIASSTGTIDKALLDGQVSGKYNINTKNSLLAGVGVRWIAPLSAKGPSNYDGNRFDADNPYLVYQYLYKWQGVQSVLQVTPTYYTNDNLVKEGYVSSVSVAQDNMYEIGSSGFSAGLSVAASYAYYNKSGPLGSPTDANYMEDVRTDQSDYGFSFDPVLEYQFNDRWNFRTVSNIWNFEHVRSESGFNTYRWDKVYQSVGIGISVTRDIFLYPNIQFLPDNIAAGQTNVALNSTINLF